MFLMYVRNIQCLDYGGQESKKQFAVYDSDTSLILNQGQGHQTWYELVDPKQGYNNAKFENLCLKTVSEKANDKVFVKSGNTSIISFQYL